MDSLNQSEIWKRVNEQWIYISNISELYTGVHGRNIAIYDVSDVKHG